MSPRRQLDLLLVLVKRYQQLESNIRAQSEDPGPYQRLKGAIESLESLNDELEYQVGELELALQRSTIWDTK